MEKPSFGKSLEEHLNLSGREIAFPIEACVTMLLECGMQEEVEAALSFQENPALTVEDRWFKSRRGCECESHVKN